LTVKVVRERSDQRRHHRVTAPLFVTLDGHRVRATDWSLGGLRVDGFPGTLPAAGAVIELHVALPFQGFDVSFDCEAEVVRTDPVAAMFAVRFTSIGERELGLMEHFIEELIRGSMVNVEDTIQRIDVPVTPASTRPDVNPLSQVPIGRWPAKTIAYTALYFTIGLFVFGYALVLGYTNFIRMEVDTAVISAPIESVRAQVDGRISYGRFRQGDRVPAGALIMHVVDNELEKEIDLSSLDIRDRKAQLDSLRHQLAEELARVNAFASVERKNVDQLQLEWQSLEAQAKAAAAQHERIRHLHDKGFATNTQAETAEKQMIAARKLADAKQLELETRTRLAEGNAGERLYTGQTFFGDRARIEGQTLLAQKQVSIAEQKLQALLNHKARLAVYAPFDGLLQELPRVSGSMVRKGDPIATIENPHAREVTAYLRQDEVLSVGLGDEVNIYLPGLSELRKARVKSIDRTAGFISEMNSTYIWRAPRDRSARVVLGFIDSGKHDSLDSYRTGTPAIAIFATRPTNYLIGDMLHRFRMVFGGRPRKKPAEAENGKPAEQPLEGTEPAESAPLAVPAKPDGVIGPLAMGPAGRPAPSGTHASTGVMPQTDLAGRDYALLPPTREGNREGLAARTLPGLADQAVTDAGARSTESKASSQPTSASDHITQATDRIKQRLRDLLSGGRTESAEMTSVPPARAAASSEAGAAPEPSRPPAAPVAQPRRLEHPARVTELPRLPRRYTEDDTPPSPITEARPRPPRNVQAPRTVAEPAEAATPPRKPSKPARPPKREAAEKQDQPPPTGVLARMRERLKALFAKTSEEDEDWGEDPSEAYRHDKNGEPPEASDDGDGPGQDAGQQIGGSHGAPASTGSAGVPATTGSIPEAAASPAPQNDAPTFTSGRPPERIGGRLRRKPRAAASLAR
jgi:multidrug resistance efflux pump